MNLNRPTLIEFENERRKNNYVPPIGSNSFYTIGDGEINVFTFDDESKRYQFDLFTNKGNVKTGTIESNDNFIIGRSEIDPDNHYRNLTVIPDTGLTITHGMILFGSTVDVHGTLCMDDYSRLYLRNNTNMILYTDSVFSISKNIEISIEKGSSLVIYGKVNINLETIDALMNTYGIVIDSAAVINVDGINTQNRVFSMTDYETELRDKIININTQGERNSGNNKYGYTWMAGSPIEHSQIIDLSVLYGTAILGDFKLSVLGIPEHTIPNLQMISNMIVSKDCTLLISETYKDGRYIHPELYVGIVIGNNKIPAKCVIDGTVIVDGINSTITVDRKAGIHINEGGYLYLRNRGTLRSTYNDNEQVLFIDGTLVIDTIDQIITFNHDNISIGKNGKVVILNPDDGIKKVLWTTPNGIRSTDLYRLFGDRIEHVEYHISNNTGISIDQYYDFYNREMINWYGGYRIEDAVHKGLIVWHDGGFIELRKEIINWISLDSTLFDIAKIFKVFASYKEEQLQECVNKLVYAGFGDIIFRFIVNEDVSEIKLTLKGIKLNSVVQNLQNGLYTISTDNNGSLFIRNNISQLTEKNIIDESSNQLMIRDYRSEFRVDDLE